MQKKKKKRKLLLAKGHIDLLRCAMNFLIKKKKGTLPFLKFRLLGIEATSFLFPQPMSSI